MPNSRIVTGKITKLNPKTRRGYFKESNKKVWSFNLGDLGKIPQDKGDFERFQEKWMGKTICGEIQSKEGRFTKLCERDSVNNPLEKRIFRKPTILSAH